MDDTFPLGINSKLAKGVNYHVINFHNITGSANDRAAQLNILNSGESLMYLIDFCNTNAVDGFYAEMDQAGYDVIHATTRDRTRMGDIVLFILRERYRAEVVETGANYYNIQQHELGDSLLNFIIVEIHSLDDSAPFSTTLFYMKVRRPTGGGLSLRYRDDEVPTELFLNCCRQYMARSPVGRHIGFGDANIGLEHIHKFTLRISVCPKTIFLQDLRMIFGNGINLPNHSGNWIEFVISNVPILIRQTFAVFPNMLREGAGQRA